MSRSGHPGSLYSPATAATMDRLLLLSLSFSAPACATAARSHSVHERVTRSIAHPPSASVELALEREARWDATARHITMPLDHFDPSNTRTWKDKFYINRGHWDEEAGPIFVEMGGEGGRRMQNWLPHPVMRLAASHFSQNGHAAAITETILCCAQLPPSASHPQTLTPGGARGSRALRWRRRQPRREKARGADGGGGAPLLRRVRAVRRHVDRGPGRLGGG